MTKAKVSLSSCYTATASMVLGNLGALSGLSSYWKKGKSFSSKHSGELRQCPPADGRAGLIPRLLAAKARVILHSSVPGDYEVCQLPGVLVSLDFDLLLLLVHGQFDCWQHRAGTLAVGREDQIDGADAVIPRARSLI